MKLIVGLISAALAQETDFHGLPITKSLGKTTDECFKEHTEQEDCKNDSECTWCTVLMPIFKWHDQCIAIADLPSFPYPAWSCYSNVRGGKKPEDCKKLGTGDECDQDNECTLCSKSESKLCDTIEDAPNLGSSWSCTKL